MRTLIGAVVAVLALAGPGALAPAPAAAAQIAQGQQGGALAIEIAFWESIKDSNNPKLFQAYLDRYPNGAFAAIARVRIDELSRTAPQPQPQPQPTRPTADNFSVDPFGESRQVSSNANVRSGPGTNYPVVGGLDAGTVVRLTGRVRDRNWFRLTVDGRTAYVHGSVLEAVAAAPTPAPTPQPTAGRGPRPGEVFTDCGDCPRMVVVPAGTFQMGSPPGEEGRWEDEGPVHRVTIPRAFAVGVFEITEGQFDAWRRANNRPARPACNIWDGDKYVEDSNAIWFEYGASQPVLCVSWNEAQDYVAWLRRKTGQPYRLLSEAEWEYMARGGATTPWSWGADAGPICQYGNVADQAGKRTKTEWKDIVPCDDGWVGPAPVGTYRPNRFGIHDTTGNVGEWVQDCAVEGYAGAPTDGRAREDKGCDRRVKRGSEWTMSQTRARAAFRNWDPPAQRHNATGFRVARDLDPGQTVGRPAPTPTPAPTAPSRQALVDYLAGLPKGGDAEWDDAVSEALLSNFDSNRSGTIDTRAEIDAIPCEVLHGIEKSYARGTTYSTNFSYLYGFDPSATYWIGDALGFAEGQRQYIFGRLKACGVP
ncbi:MAG: SUMF1/EgtB/PvdO family nonheme iron enzyme [Alphaproteobacteria bacterium]